MERNELTKKSKRMTKARKEALLALLEWGFLEMSTYDFDNENGFTREDCETAYDIITERYDTTDSNLLGERQ